MIPAPWDASVLVPDEIETIVPLPPTQPESIDGNKSVHESIDDDDGPAYMKLTAALKAATIVATRDSNRLNGGHKVYARRDIVLVDALSWMLLWSSIDSGGVGGNGKNVCTSTGTRMLVSHRAGIIGMSPRASSREGSASRGGRGVISVSPP